MINLEDLGDGLRLYNGDCRDLIASLPDSSVDSVVTDPPYEIGFMNRGFDRTGIAFDVDLWRGILRVLTAFTGFFGYASVISSWKTLRDCAYPNIDANAAETWDLAVWLAYSPQFGGTPIRAMRQRELRDALNEYWTLFQSHAPEDVTVQLNRLERLMHDVDWTGQYVHAFLLFRQMKDSHLKYWRQLDEAYWQTLRKLNDSMRLEDMREDVQLSTHRMVILDGLQINCGQHGTTGKYTVGYEDGGVL